MARNAKRRAEPRAGASGAAAPPRAAGPPAAVVALAFVAIALVLYAPALGGPFFSDDQHYVQRNVYIQNPGIDSWIAIWSPTSVVVSLVENWAPVQLTLHAAAWRAFGASTPGHHVLNVVAHALASALLFAFFARCGIDRRVALVLATIFLVHPGNVEAVAWISQLKTTTSLALALGALLLQPRRPAPALVVFALALLAKPTAAVALPVALVLAWPRGDAGHPVRSLAWLSAWGLAFAAFAAAELAAFFETAGRAESLYADPLVRVRSHVGIAARYAVLAATGWRRSLFHEPAPAESWLDAWWLAGFALVVAIAARSTVLLSRVRRSEASGARRSAASELAFWVWTAVSFVPVSGLASLPYPMADRYLYFLLPGLLGALAFAVPELGARLSLPAVSSRGRVLAAAAGVAIVALGFATNRHAVLWAEPERLLAHAEQAYPEGQLARLRAARRAARRGDAEQTAALLGRAIDRGFDRLDVLLSDPDYAPLRGTPAFDAVVDRLARAMIADLEARSDPSQVELRVLAQARQLVGDLAGAEAAYRRALDVGGPFDVEVRRELDAVGLARRLEERRER